MTTTVTPLDDPRRAVNLLDAAQRCVRYHMDDGGKDREAADAALTRKTDATILAAEAAPVLPKYLDDLAGKLMVEAATADARVRAGEDPAAVLTEFSNTVHSIATAVGD